MIQGQQIPILPNRLSRHGGFWLDGKSVYPNLVFPNVLWMPRGGVEPVLPSGKYSHSGNPFGVPFFSTQMQLLVDKRFFLC
jgi:hypothetical protein